MEYRRFAYVGNKKGLEINKAIDKDIEARGYCGTYCVGRTDFQP